MKNNSRLNRFLKLFSAFLLILYLIICLYFYIYQEKLLFHPEEIKTSYSQSLEPYEIYWQHNSVKLHGWYINNNNKNLLVYFGGNAETIANTLNLYYNQFKNEYDILSMEYRGFGLSSGKPSEQNIVSDGNALIEEWMQKYHYSSQNIILIGRSLGTGVTMQIAHRIQPKGIILITPYDSINAVAQSYYPYIPIAYLNYNPFLSDKIAHEVKSSTMVIIAENDIITPKNHGLNLASKFANKPEILTLENGEHHNVYDYKETWQNMRNFIKKILVN